MDEKKKKKSKALPIILAAIVVLLFGFCLFVYIKLGGMSKNAVVTVPKPTGGVEIIQPKETLVPVANPDDLDLSDDFEPDIDPDQISDDPIFHLDAKDKDVVNILFVGNDALDAVDHGRTDSMILISYNKRTREAKMLSFLRDTWIYIPGRSTWNRLNTAFRFGGVGLMINTINTNFDLDIQYYMRVDFNSLVEITDRLGGIDLELSETEIEYINNGNEEKLPVKAGWHHLNGRQTLTHARNRRIGNGDWSRTERQRNIMFAFLRRAKQEKNVVALSSLVYDLIDKVETNLTPSQLVSLAVDVVFGGEIDIKNRPVPFEGTWEYAWEGKMAVIHIDIERNAQLINNYIYGE